MSHLTEVKVEFQDMECLRKAFQAYAVQKGATVHTNEKVVMYGDKVIDQICDVTIRVNGVPRIGYSKETGKVLGDFWYLQDDSRQFELHIEKEYNVEVVHKFAQEYEWEIVSDESNMVERTIVLEQENYDF